jgi:hypothetical protein
MKDDHRIVEAAKAPGKRKGTTAQHMLNVFDKILAGEQPDPTDVIFLRAAVLSK